jgi:hypothetical protein
VQESFKIPCLQQAALVELSACRDEVMPANAVTRLVLAEDQNGFGGACSPKGETIDGDFIGFPG